MKISEVYNTSFSTVIVTDNKLPEKLLGNLVVIDNRKYKNTPIQIRYFLANLYQGKTLSFYLFFYYETFLFHSVTTFQ